MKKARLLLILGIWVAVLPHLGFPSLWKNILFLLTGLGIIYLAFALYKSHMEKEGLEKTFDNFSENKYEDKEVEVESMGIDSIDIEQ